MTKDRNSQIPDKPSFSVMREEEAYYFLLGLFTGFIGFGSFLLGLFIGRKISERIGRFNDEMHGANANDGDALVLIRAA